MIRSRRPSRWPPIAWRRPTAQALAQAGGLAFGALLFWTLIVVSVEPYYRVLPAGPESEAAFSSQLDTWTPRILAHFNVPGAVVATVAHGAPSKVYAYGYADRAQRRPMTPDTVFRVASLSKSVTAWGVLRLAQDGKVALDAPVSRYLPRWPVAPSRYPADGVTVRRLLNHTSGLNAGEDSFSAPDAEPTSTLALLGRQGPGPASNPGPPRLVAPPGGQFIYSVPGYTLLQLMIEHKSGLAFPDYMRRALLEPLGMSSSSFRWDARLRGRTATPYDAEGRALAMQAPDDQAADSLFATAPDLARFIAAPLPDRRSSAGAGVLSPDMVDRIYLDPSQAPNLTLSSVAPERPGLGYYLEAAPGRPPIVSNVGLDPGWSSLFMISPTTGDGVVVLTNSDAGAPAIAQIISIWTSWRGLPAGMLTDGYRKVGLATAAFIGVLAALAAAYGAGLLLELSSGRRRFGFGDAANLSGARFELAVAASVVAIWAGAFTAVRTMPTLHAVGVSAVVAFVTIVLARALMPSRDPAPAATRPHPTGYAVATA
jgi:CubicO group peptidase (beta-lactamase class C family)